VPTNYQPLLEGNNRYPDMSETLVLSEEPQSEDQRSAPQTRYKIGWLFFIAALALVVKLLLALRTFGTNDVYSYERFASWAGYLGGGMYRASPDFNHPPSMIHVLVFLNWLGHVTGLGFPFFIRLPAILADVGNLWIVCRILGPRLQTRSIWWGVLLIAAAPNLILISGFHGNTDSVMMFFVLLTVYLIEQHGSSKLAGAAFGLALCIKIAPIMLVPAIVFYLKDLRQRIVFLAFAAAAVLTCWSPFLWQVPGPINHNVIGYRSIYGHWGVSYLLERLSAHFSQVAWINTVFQSSGPFVLLGAFTFLSFWMNRKASRPDLFSQCGLIFLLLLSLTSGFSVQYLCWLVPWLVELGLATAVVYHVASFVFLFLVYNYWSGGLPWYLADSFRVGDYQDHLDYFQFQCWFVVSIALWVAWKRIKEGVSFHHAVPVRVPVLVRSLTVAAFSVASLAYAVSVQISDDKNAKPGRPGHPEKIINSIRAKSDLNLMVWLARMGRDRDSDKLAEEAAKLDPEMGFQFVPVPPCRIFDSRNTKGQKGSLKLRGGETRSISVLSGTCGIPASAQAYSLNATAVPTTGTLGYLTLWPTGRSRPNASTLNSPDGSAVATAAIVPAGTGGSVNVFAQQDTDLVLDINGFFSYPRANTLAFYPLVPCRAVDTRFVKGPSAGPAISGNSVRDFQLVNSVCGIPPIARAYSLNLTAVPHGPLGYITAWPTGQPRPISSVLNSPDGSVVANAAIVSAGTPNGSTSYYASNDTDLIIDVNGYFAPPTEDGLNFHTVNPCRAVDTRNPSGSLGGPVLLMNASRTFPLPSSDCGVPPTAAAYSLNITVAPKGFLGYLNVWPTGQSPTNVSTLNDPKGLVSANAALVRAGKDGAIDLYVLNKTHVIIDINGFFAR
jgi:hypothetical protein